jgi:isopentenyldiphosphate isomerase
MSTGSDGGTPEVTSTGPSGGELVELVDERGRVTDVVSRARMRAERLRHRCTFVAVRDPRGRVLVHRRSPHKDLWGDRWDLAVGGVVQAGEDWTAAAARELEEEVGVRGVDLVPLVDEDLLYADADVAELARAWTVTWDGPVSFDDGEVVEARWVTLDELRDLVQRDPFVPDSLALVLPLLLRDPRPGD